MAGINSHSSEKKLIRREIRATFVYHYIAIVRCLFEFSKAVLELKIRFRPVPKPFRNTRIGKIPQTLRKAFPPL